MQNQDKNLFCNFYFQMLAQFRAHTLQSELNKVSKSNFLKLQLQRMSSKIERVFKKIKNKKSIKIGPKSTLIRQLNGP